MTPRVRELPITPGSLPLGTSHLPGEGTGVDLVPLGYTEREFLVDGTAGEYRHIGGVLERTGERPFTTRVLVRAPAPDRFSGVVQAEPLHPDYDSALAWRTAHAWITATGAAWVGITQDHRCARVLRDDFDPERYRELSIASAGLRWDIVGGVLAALRTPGAGVLDSELAGRTAHVYLSGWSNTGSFCRVFLQDGFHRRHRLADGRPAVDGYLIGISSGAAGAAGYPPLGEDSELLPPDDPRRTIGPAGVPVFEVLSEFESETHRAALRPDGDAPDDRYRLYQVAGTSHHDPLADGVLTNGAQFRRLGHDVPERRIAEQVSDAHLDAVARAAYDLLHRWAATGRAPVRASRFTFTGPGSAPPGTPEALARDASGNVLGGVRTPWVEAPLASYSPHSTPAPGSCRPSPWAPHGGPEQVARLIGRMTPLPPADIARLYAGRDDYLARFDAACARLERQGLLLERDARMLADEARGRRFPQQPVRPLGAGAARDGPPDGTSDAELDEKTSKKGNLP